VLITPISFRQVDWLTRRFHLALTRDKIKNSPSVDVDKPVSRQQELDLFGYYEYPYYWGYPGLWGMGAYPNLLAVGGRNQVPAKPEPAESGDIHLRSAKEMRGYHIEEQTQRSAHVDDFIIDDETWAVRYLVIDTRKLVARQKGAACAPLDQPHQLGRKEGLRRPLSTIDQEQPRVEREPHPSTASTKHVCMTITDARPTGTASTDRQRRRHTTTREPLGVTAQFLR